ncbi:aminotransferase class V-fold PLP-dependent enzyme [uncultured Roseovarius sp.]|uniref:pyridoxal phosphate-dependent decarboxylase family protein n=1 Tax=uncultured Roseovarius sp. TaxID=293344 RepID=UPI002626B84B|nr:aminotransferase class V-fold PLP-dependent enzyme [uncultured Roseovarius sp.]
MTIPSDPLHIQSEAFEAGAKRGADYLRSLSSRNVHANTNKLGDLDFPLPDTGLSASDVLELLDDAGRDATVASAAGRYFGYVIGGALPAASGARAMLSAWDQVADALTGPSVLKLEDVAIRWVVDLLNLPDETQGAFTSGATMANMSLLVTARDVLLERQGHARGLGLIGAPPIRVVASKEIHATVLKSLRMAGLGTANIEYVDTDGQGRMRLDDVPTLDQRTLVIAQAGNVCTGAVDPIGEIARRSKEAGAWLHVDGAFGLWMRAGTETSRATKGIELADSWVVDAHKTLNAPYDSGLALCRHPDEFRASMAIGASYLPATDPSPADFAPEFSRSARGAETWAALLSLGGSGVRDLVDRFHHHAIRISQELQDMGFLVPHEIHFNQVFATLPEGGDRAAAIVQKIQTSGAAWFGAATWQGHSGFRISVSNWSTSDDDIDRLIRAIATAK